MQSGEDFDFGILPEPQRTMLRRLLDTMRSDRRIAAVLSGGSLLHGGFDAHSDIDLVIVCTAAGHDELAADKIPFAETLGPLIAAFTGEHVGEPRLLICLYGPPLIHVDLKFVVLADLCDLVERPLMLWAQDRAAVEASLDGATIAWPNRDPQWFEDRAWVWLHYGATKLHRGELFEAMGMISFIREQVLVRCSTAAMASRSGVCVGSKLSVWRRCRF